MWMFLPSFQMLIRFIINTSSEQFFRDLAGGALHCLIWWLMHIVTVVKIQYKHSHFSKINIVIQLVQSCTLDSQKLHFKLSVRPPERSFHSLSCWGLTLLHLSSLKACWLRLFSSNEQKYFPNRTRPKWWRVPLRVGTWQRKLLLQEVMSARFLTAWGGSADARPFPTSCLPAP